MLLRHDYEMDLLNKRNEATSNSSSSKSSGGERSAISTESVSKSTPFTLRKAVTAATATPISCSKRKKKNRYPNDILPGGLGPVLEPNKNDVLSGRGGKINSHLGNVQFREMVKSNQAEYLSQETKKLDKAKIADKIVQQIRNLNPPGRFLRHDPATNAWIEIGDARARKKTGQAMREGAPNIREELQTNAASTKNTVASQPDSDDDDNDTDQDDAQEHLDNTQKLDTTNTYMAQNNAFQQHQLQQHHYPGFHPDYQITNQQQRSPPLSFYPHQHMNNYQDQILMMNSTRQAQTQPQSQQPQQRTQNFITTNQPVMSNQVGATNYQHQFFHHQQPPRSSLNNFYSMNMSDTPVAAAPNTTNLPQKTAVFEREFTVVRPTLNSSDTAGTNFSSMSLGSILDAPSLTSSGTSQTMRRSASPNNLNTDPNFDRTQWPNRPSIDNHNINTYNNVNRQGSMNSVKFFLEQLDNSDGNIKSYLPTQLRTLEASNPGSFRNNSNRLIDTTFQFTRGPLRRSSNLRRSMSLTELDDIDINNTFITSMGENSMLRFLEVSEGSLPTEQQQQQQHQQYQQTHMQLQEQPSAANMKAQRKSSSSGSSRGSILRSAGSSKSKSPNSKEGVGWVTTVQQNNPRLHFARGKPPSQSSNMSTGSVRSSGSSWLNSYNGTSAGSSRSILSDLSTDMIALDLAENSPFLRDSINHPQS